MTLINYEKKGLIKPLRTPGGVRRYKVEGIEKLLGMLENGQKQEQEKTRKIILYARVSTKKQAEYLENQVKRLEEYAKSNSWNYEVIKEIASGLNSDILARFGFNYLKEFLTAFGVELIVINGKEKERTQELAEDLVAIVTSFAAKIYGQRGSKKK